jgi:hypothetical protein
MTCIDEFLQAVTSGDGIPAHVYAERAVLDATVPGWRFHRQGAADIATTYTGWFGHPGEFEELDRQPTDRGEVVRYVVTWVENGTPHAAHHVHLLTTDGGGRIARDVVFCGGRWPAALLAQMAEADR